MDGDGFGLRLIANTLGTPRKKNHSEGEEIFDEGSLLRAGDACVISFGFSLSRLRERSDQKGTNRAKEQEIFNEIHDYTCCAAIEPFYGGWLFDDSPVRARVWPDSFYLWGDN